MKHIELTLSQRLARLIARRTGLLIVPVEVVMHWAGIAKEHNHEAEVTQCVLEKSSAFHNGSSHALRDVLRDINNHNPA